MGERDAYWSLGLGYLNGAGLGLLGRLAGNLHGEDAVLEAGMDGAVKDIEGWDECFPKARLAGVVRGTGVSAEGDIQGRPGVLEESRTLGRQC